MVSIHRSLRTRRSSDPCNSFHSSSCLSLFTTVAGRHLEGDSVTVIVLLPPSSEKRGVLCSHKKEALFCILSAR